MRKASTTPCEIYDHALKYCRDFRLPPGTPKPCSTTDWLPENIATLERYYDWLTSGGASEAATRRVYIPMAGHVLSLNKKLSSQLDLQTDLQKAIQYILAKQHGPDWTHLCEVALDRFRRFLLQERGLADSRVCLVDPIPNTDGLPAWLVQELKNYQHTRQPNWREARLTQNIRRFWSGHLRLWRFLVEKRGVAELADLTRQKIFDYTEARLNEKVSVRGINSDLRSLHAFLAFLQEQGYRVSHALLRFPCLKEPDALPKFLTDEQVIVLKNDFESRLLQTENAKDRRDALLDRAFFYLLWQSGLRLGELEELRLEDLDLPGKRLTVRRGKGLSDRTVYLTTTTVHALEAYLTVRGMGPTGHVFFYRNLPLCKDLVYNRIHAAGKRVEIHVYPHRLRHTCATQLLNAGCRITSIQKFLGHKRLNTTLTYARVHDQTVADDYFMAMNSVERRLDLLGSTQSPAKELQADERQQLLGFADKLSIPDLSLDTRLEIAGKMRSLLNSGYIPEENWIPPPASTVDSVVIPVS